MNREQVLNRAIGPVYRQLREQISKYGDPTPSNRTYDTDLATSTYNDWVDREMEKWHNKIKAMRAIQKKRDEVKLLGDPTTGNIVEA